VPSDGPTTTREPALDSVRDLKHLGHELGHHRRFRYIQEAWHIALRQPRTGAFIFPYKAASIKEAFRRACRKLGIDNLHFHDLRHEAPAAYSNAAMTFTRSSNSRCIPPGSNWCAIPIYGLSRFPTSLTTHRPRLINSPACMDSRSREIRILDMNRS
jgi:hypothetical protein